MSITLFGIPPQGQKQRVLAELLRAGRKKGAGISFPKEV
jgi:hypothetical protein